MVPACDSSDAELVRRAQQRDAEAVTELYRRHAPRIYRYCLFRGVSTAAAEDVTEEVFLNMVEALPRYQERGLPFSAWLYRLAHDRLVDFHRREARQPTTLLGEDLADGAPAPEDQVARRAQIDQLRQTMSRLSEEYQLVLHLRFVEGFALEETARQMNKTIGAIKVLQHRALRRLAQLIGNHED